MKKSGNMPKPWKWCRKKHHGWYMPKQFNENVAGCWRCHAEEKRISEGRCLAEIHHGPGHQSSTYCEVIGPHKIHRCIVGGDRIEASWVGSPKKPKFTGYFDEVPYIE